MNTLALPGAQAFVPAVIPGSPPFVRTPTHLYALSSDEPLRAELWASDANVGPGVWSAGEAGSSARVLGALAHGVGEVKAGEKALGDELFFGESVRMHDLAALSDASGRTRLFALVQEDGALALLLLPDLPWGTDVTPSFERGAVEDAQGFANVALE